MSVHKITRKILAGALTAIGFAACTVEEPDLYGTPLLYGPLPVDSIVSDTTSQPFRGACIADDNQDIANENEMTNEHP